jgi:hypothetical protein
MTTAVIAIHVIIGVLSDILPLDYFPLLACGPGCFAICSGGVRERSCLVFTQGMIDELRLDLCQNCPDVTETASIAQSHGDYVTTKMSTIE